MRVALLSYRSKTHCGGQGVYVRHLSRGLVELGHDVEVFSGQPYPEGLDPRVTLTKVPSLDLYREPDPFRIPWPNEIKTRIDLLELLTTWTAGFPEPQDVQPARGAGTGRAPRRLRRRARQPVPRHRPAEDRRAGAARCGDRSPSDHPRPRARRGRGAVVAQAVGAPLVRLRGDAEGRRPPDPRTADGVVDVGRRHRRGLRGVIRSTACRPARRGHRRCSSPPNSGCATASSRSRVPTSRSRA